MADEIEEKEENTTDDIRGDIAKAIDSLADTEDQAEASPSDVLLESKTEAATTLESAEAPAQKEKEQVSTEKAREAQKTTSDSQAQEGTEAPVIAPISWSAEEKQVFAKLPRELQEKVVERERQRDGFVQRKSQELSATLRDYSDAVPVIDAEHQRLISRGLNLSKGQMLNALIQGQQYMDQNPEAAIRQLAESYGVNLSQLSESAPVVDPRTNQLAAQVAQYQSHFAQLQAQQQQQYEQYLVGTVESFKTAKNDKGQPLYPYANDPAFENLMAEEAQILRRRDPNMQPADILKASYENTIWKVPELRDAEIKKQQGIAEARRISAEKEKAAQARKMSVSVSGAPNGTVPMRTSGSLRDDLLAAAESLGW